jgi:hypothetical protein
MHKYRILLLFFAISIPTWHQPSAAITLDFDGAEYTATTAETITAAWIASTIGSVACTDCEYELRLYHVERKTYVDGGKTVSLTKAFTLPKTGHYVVEVRGCQGIGTSRLCSDWATSMNDTNSPMVDGTLKKWRVYGRPASSGAITISK